MNVSTQRGSFLITQGPFLQRKFLVTQSIATATVSASQGNGSSDYQSFQHSQQHQSSSQNAGPTPASLDDLNELIRIFKRRQTSYLQLVECFRKRKDFEVNYKEQLAYYADLKVQENSRLIEENQLIRLFSGFRIQDSKQKMLVTRFCMRACEMHEEFSMKLRNLLAFDSAKEKALNVFKEHMHRLLNAQDALDLETILVLLASRFARSMFEELERVRTSVLQDADLMLVLMDTIEEEEMYINGYLAYEKPLYEQIYSTSPVVPQQAHATNTWQKRADSAHLLRTRAQIQISLQERLEQQRRLFHFYAKQFFKLYDVLSLDKHFMREEVAQLRVGREDKTFNDLQAKNIPILTSLKIFISHTHAKQQQLQSQQPTTKYPLQYGTQLTKEEKEERSNHIQRLLTVDFFSAPLLTSSPAKQPHTGFQTTYYFRDSQKPQNANTSKPPIPLVTITASPAIFLQSVSSKLLQNSNEQNNQQSQTDKRQIQDNLLFLDSNSTDQTIIYQPTYPLQSHLDLHSESCLGREPSVSEKCRLIVQPSGSYQTHLEQFGTIATPVLRTQQLQWNQALEDPKKGFSISKSPLRSGGIKQSSNLLMESAAAIETQRKLRSISRQQLKKLRAQSNPRSSQLDESRCSNDEFDDQHATAIYSKKQQNARQLNQDLFDSGLKKQYQQQQAINKQQQQQQQHLHQMQQNKKQINTPYEKQTSSAFMIKIRNHRGEIEPASQDFIPKSTSIHVSKPNEYQSNLINRSGTMQAQDFDEPNYSHQINRNQINRLASNIFIRRSPKNSKPQLQQQQQQQSLSHQSNQQSYPSQQMHQQQQHSFSTHQQAQHRTYKTDKSIDQPNNENLSFTQMNESLNPSPSQPNTAAATTNMRLTSNSLHTKHVHGDCSIFNRQQAHQLIQNQQQLYQLQNPPMFIKRSDPYFCQQGFVHEPNNQQPQPSILLTTQPSFSISLSKNHVQQQQHLNSNTRSNNNSELPPQKWTALSAVEQFAKRYLVMKSKRVNTMCLNSTTAVPSSVTIGTTFNNSKEDYDENDIGIGNGLGFVQVQMTQFPLGLINKEKKRKKKCNPATTVELNTIGFHEKSLKMRKIKAVHLPSLQTIQSNPPESAYFDPQTNFNRINTLNIQNSSSIDQI